ncbi:pyridoxal-phosphate-dependent aminotransferase family protein [Litoreibacter janthinus]|uniref:Alanine-glyoxylate transaminase / serine-glyoxylate transaminase / serine-pyruvate transaminase n=1 Tax=Litoreibacter janthinus TaxID=670154 RepID=A0A1I6HQ05_9RHOB|nr:aminotransferase class V-fold PLP-dependent enzyme [Litoreibacter janthinus]SFR56447.1 alanine-glyoxylate transaminase / serine-glyoxylate transaminase / serine-pyruvate transaminase [Litoreibacter janthinus]
MSNLPNLSHGRHTLAIPGPSVMPERVLQAMHRPAPNIYTGELVDLTYSLFPDLKVVAKTAGQVALYIGNGHAAWEASLANVLAPGDKVLIPGAAQFSLGWGVTAEKRGLVVEHLDFGRRAPIDPQAVEDALRADTDHKIKAVLVVQVDTASSAKSDLAAIRAAMDAAAHSALLIVDSIACLGCDDMQMDAWGVDILVTGSQKGLMVPPGMCFVFFNAKAAAARDKMERVSAYWDWKPRADPEMYYQISCGTAPTHHLYGLRVALDMIVHEEGLDNVLARHATLARALWAACDVWGQAGPLELNIADTAARSNAVTSLRIGAPHGARLRDWVTDQAGLTLGIGLGMATDEDPQSDGFFRIGHMGHVNAHMLMGTLGSIDAAFKALDVPHGAGALEAASAVCAGQ